MKSIRPFFFLLGLVVALAGGQLFAQPPPPAAPSQASTEESSPAAADTPEDSTKNLRPADPAADPSVEPEPSKSGGKLRDLTAPTTESAPKPAEDVEVEQDKKKLPPARPRHRSSGGERAVVVFGDAYLAPGETGQVVVAVFGSAQAEGPVQEAVVAVFGNSEARDNVGEAVVAVMGNATAEKSVGGDVVAVMGNARVNGRVRGQVVAVFGDVWLGPNAEVSGDIVSVAGRVIRDSSAVVHGNITEVPFLRHFPVLGTLGIWFQQAILKGRLLSLHQHLVWPWAIAFSFLGFYLLLALGFGPTITRCAETLEQRPLKTMFAALLALVVAPALMVVLLITVIGAAAVFFAVLTALLVGKAAFLAWIGRRFSKSLGVSNVVLSVLIGGLLVVVLYTLPVIGLLVWMMGSTLGLGMAVYTVILTTRRDRVARPLPPGSQASSFSSVPAGVATASSAPFPITPSASASSPPLPPLPTFETAGAVPPPIRMQPSFAGLPRAGFWIRLAASLLDAIMVAIAAGVMNLGDLFLLLLTAYSIVMWAKKGTTVGGIICGLKVVRVDERPIDWSVAIVRALGAFLSFCVAGLGFIWVAFDDERQSWHDKISGTTIVRVPRGVSLI